jgi:sarcosine oxidase subunit alpha
MPRLGPPRDPVTITFDGATVQAERGEPVAAALVAAGHVVLARSAKFHRPRGPACFRAACDGCLARVDDEPNVMTCMVPAAEGTTVEAQNTLGTRDMDLLRMTDWFFPQGMNHHELFAGVPGLQQVMQAFARRVAGLGRLPKEARAPREARRREADVVVIGAGAAGMAAATALASRGRAVEVVDDALAHGGGLRALGPADARPFAPLVDAFEREVARGGVRLRTRTTAGGFYGDDLLVAGEDGAEVLGARAFVVATGAHDGVLAFEGNDVPGVMSARAAGWLLAGGVLVGRRVAVVVAEGGGPFGEAYARAVRAKGAECDVTVLRGAPVRARGSSRVKEVFVVGEGGRETSAKCDALLVDAPRAPAYELCEQVDPAALTHEPRGYVVREGKIGDRVYAVGEVAGWPYDAPNILTRAHAVASQIA